MTEVDPQRVRDLEAELASARADHAATLSQVDRLATNVRQVAASLDSFRAQFTNFVEEDRLARNMQFAQAALIDVRAQRDREFGHYATVRRGTIGMLQAMDAGIVTETSLRQAAERLMIDTPGYWLAPVQVALAAWISDSQELATRALLEAMSRDPNKTALFFSLVLARHQRYKAAAEWMREYVHRQDPRALSREFTVVLDAVAQGALGGRALDIIKERCVTWYDQLRSAEDIVQEQSLRWRRHMSRNRRKLADQFGVLPDICPDWDNVVQWLEAATVYEQTEHWLRTQLETTIVRRDGPRQRVDGVLRNLVTSYDEDEDSLRQQEMKWERVIECWGDHAKAARLEEDESLADEPLVDFLTLLTTIGLTPEKAGASVTTQQLAIRLANDWIASAAQGLSIKGHDNNPESIKVEMGKWHGELRSDDNEDEAARSYSSFIDGEVRSEVGRMTMRGPTATLVAAFICLMMIVIAFALGWIVGSLPFAGAVVASLAFLGGSYLWFWHARQILPERKNEARRKGEAQKQAGRDELRKATGEARRAFRLRETELAKKSSLLEFLREQNTYTDSLSVPSIEPKDRPVGSTEVSRSLTGLPDNPAKSPVSQHGGQSFAFKLPDWDLRPPDLPLERTTSI